MTESNSSTLLGLLDQWCQDRPEKIAYRFLGDGQQETATLTYVQLCAAVDRCAGQVRNHCAPGERVALLFTPSLDFVSAFLGVLRAGCVAVPVAPPHAAGATVGGLRAIMANAGAALVLTDLPRHEVADWLEQPSRVLQITDTDGDTPSPRPWLAEPAGEQLALLQYTSGSTGRPRGVMVTHDNLMDNEERIHRAFGQDETAVIVSWLPVYHDMGLIGSVLHALYLGATAVLMPPESFLRRPARWLQALSRYRGTISPAPDFAYALCARKVTTAQLADLDLRSWQVACCGSEPVRVQTVQEFSRVFAPAGFRPESFSPSYGLAEATLLVSGTGAGIPRILSASESGLDVPAGTVSCGPCERGEVVIVRDGAALPDGTVGEIWVRNSSVAAGYWGDEAATMRIFRARLAGHDGEDGSGYLRTGDLGAIWEHELYLTGRLKDVIIVRGRNHYPQDIEATVQRQDSRLMAGNGAAFLVGEEVTVVQAVRGTTDLSGLAERVRQAIARDHGLPVHEVLLVRPAGVPKTSSGKVRRSLCRESYLADTLSVAYRDRDWTAGSTRAGSFARRSSQTANGAAVSPELQASVAMLLDIAPEEFPADQPLTALGLDSLRAMKVQQVISDQLKTELRIDAVLGGASLRDLVQLAADAAPVVQEVRIDGELSDSQRALWFLSHWNEGGADAYVLRRAVELLRDPGDDLLRDAVHAVVARHAQLRSRIVQRDGLIVREEWRLNDLTWFRSVGVMHPAELPRIVRAEAARQIDLSTDPLFQVVLFRSPDSPPVLLLAASHLIADLHSFAIVLAEIGAFCTHGPAALSDDAGAPFELAVARERRELAAESTQRELDDWAAELADAPPLPLPRDRERVAPTAFGGDVLTVRCEEISEQAVRDLAVELMCTPFTVLLAIYHGFLDRISGIEDITVGVTVAQRGHTALARTVGYLINMVAVRVCGDADDSLADRVRLVKPATIRSLARSGIPLARLVQRTRVPQDLSVSPLFTATCGGLHEDLESGQVGLTGLSLEVADAVATLGGLTVRSFPLPLRTAVTDLDLTFGFVDGALAIRFNYSTEVFLPRTAEAMLASMRAFTAAALRAPTRRLAELPLWAGETGIAWPAKLDVPAATLRELFAGVVRALPEEPALVQGEQTWTYRELSAWAAALASQLADAVADSSRRAGDAPVVGLFFGSEPRFVTGMVAALSAGYGFMPLPRDLPDERIAFMIGDSGITAILAPPEDIDRLRRLTVEQGLPVVVAVTAKVPTACAGLPVEQLPAPAQISDPVAYIVYTSGTTGKPKGVIIPDSGVLPLLCWQQQEFGVGPGMRMAQTCALSFDVGIQELLTVLMFGGAICLPLAHERYSADDYGRFLARDQVNAMYATPTFVRDLIANRIPMHTIRTVQIAGELLTHSVVASVRPLFAPDCRIYNGYGPTETSINCAMHQIPAGAVAGESLPVGRPTGLARLYVLDRHHQPMPPELRGEVYIGGPGVGRGYRNRAEENRARFLPDSVVPDGGRMYRTGDLGMLRADGNLEITGRIDDQVKIRGYRVEPGEVEALLGRDPRVRDCAVIVDRAERISRLVAGVTGEGLSVSDLYRALAEKLPGYMMPSRIAVLSELPRTRHGKLDTRALLAAAERATTHGAGAGAGAGIITAVVRIWCDLIGVSDLDVDTPFFEAGGSSLMVAHAVHRIAQETGIDLTLSAIFQFPTARLLAAHMESVREPEPDRPGHINSSAPPLATARRVRGRQHQLKRP